MTENPVGAPAILSATATDSFGASLAVTGSLLSGDLSEGGTYVTYRLTATDPATSARWIRLPFPFMIWRISTLS